ncbi:MAG: hypothetical protein R3C10_25250 [Pirellulales bacterium]|nr:hypothetical protein [Planctomycetales bacterium]
MLSESEQNVLRTYREYLISPGEMLCFSGQDLERHSATLERLIDKKLLIKETFKGGYSLTNAGFSAMRQCS